MSKPTIADAVRQLEQLEMVKQLGQRKRDRTFSYWSYVTLLTEDT